MDGLKLVVYFSKLTLAEAGFFASTISLKLYHIAHAELLISQKLSEKVTKLLIKRKKLILTLSKM